MAEVAALAAFEVVETTVQGAAVGAIAVSRPTVPIVVRFHKIQPSPSPALAVAGHSLSYVKGRAYVFGGDRGGGGEGGRENNDMQIITLPSDLSLGDVDYQAVKAVKAPGRPLEAYSDQQGSLGRDSASAVSKFAPPVARSAHAATALGSNVFIFGGREPGEPGGDEQASRSLIDEQGTVHVFSTISKDWTALVPQSSATSSGVPQPRVGASMTATIHPAPQEELRASTEAHGTLILHGGYTIDGKLLRDTWAFDVSSRMWSQWPDLPAPGVEDVAGDGRVFCTEGRLWRVGDSFGAMAYLEISREVADDFSGKSELGVTPKTGKWEVLSFSTMVGNSTEPQKKEITTPTARADLLPVPRRGAGFLPVTSGAGRKYLLYFMGEEAPGSSVPDIWTFQIASEKFSPAVMKDKIRSAVGANTGEHAWARCDVVEASKQEGEIERPTGLAGLAADAWTDLGGGAVVIWGGKDDGGEVKNEGWVLTVD